LWQKISAWLVLCQLAETFRVPFFESGSIRADFGTGTDGPTSHNRFMVLLDSRLRLKDIAVKSVVIGKP
jgi:hypothetical protein